MVVLGVDVLPQPLEEISPLLYTYEGSTLYLWDWMTAIMTCNSWKQTDYEMHVLVGVAEA